MTGLGMQRRSWAVYTTRMAHRCIGNPHRVCARCRRCCHDGQHEYGEQDCRILQDVFGLPCEDIANSSSFFTRAVGATFVCLSG